ncbi:hypothetical protein [Streptomyces sp. NPDC014623]
MDVGKRHGVRETGRESSPFVMSAHGFGCPRPSVIEEAAEAVIVFVQET